MTMVNVSFAFFRCADMHVMNLLRLSLGQEIHEREITMIQQNDDYDSVIQRANEIPELNCCKQ